jgi:hypothetical protein
MIRRGQLNVTRRINMTTRKELVEALRLRYRSAAFSDRIKILDEFVALTVQVLALDGGRVVLHADSRNPLLAHSRGSPTAGPR